MPGKIKMRYLSDGEKIKHLGDFYAMMGMMKNYKEMKIFLKDILKTSEIIMISRRIQIAKMLLNGFTHRDIVDELKVGNSTVSGVSSWLGNGIIDYEKVLEYSEEDKKKYFRKLKKNKEFRNGYPSVFTLINMMFRN